MVRGWKRFNLDPPIEWDGASNIVFQFSFENLGYSGSGAIYSASTGQPERCRYARTDSQDVFEMDGNGDKHVPFLKIGFAPPFESKHSLCSRLRTLGISPCVLQTFLARVGCKLKRAQTDTAGAVAAQVNPVSANELTELDNLLADQDIFEKVVCQLFPSTDHNGNQFQPPNGTEPCAPSSAKEVASDVINREDGAVGSDAAS